VIRRYAAAAGLAALLGGCPFEASTPRGYEPTFQAIQRDVFNVSCSTRSCHGSPGFKGRLDLEEGKAYAALVGIPPDNAAALAAGLLRVAPGNPEKSFLVIKLTGPAPDQGDRMPSRSLALPPAAVAAVEAWIRNGAKP